MKKIGILTGGGDCPGLNAVIRAAVRTAVHQYGWECLGYLDGYRGLALGETTPLTYDGVSGLLDRGGTILGTSNRDNPFNFRCADGELRDLSGQALDNLARDKVEALVVIGGDGTMTGAEQFRELGVTLIGVPKTIDNDLLATDYTFGFHTAVATATEALDRLHTTAESHHRLMVMEVMGRYAGWIALHAGLAGGADVILIPELPYDTARVAEAIEQRRRWGRNYSIIVVSEGVRPRSGQLITRGVVADSPDPLRLGGVSSLIAAELEQWTGVESRCVVLGHLQRGGRPIPFDRILATRFGAQAVEALAAGESGKMVALQGNDIVCVPLAQVAGKQKLVAPDHPLVAMGRGLGVCFGD